MELKDLFLAQLSGKRPQRERPLPGWVDFMIEKDELNFDDP